MSDPGVVSLPRRLAAPAPGWSTSAEVIVIGSGIAGLTCALRLREQGRQVLLVTKTRLAAGSTAWAQGGIAAALAETDSPQDHLDDTLVAGVGLCDEDAVRTLVTEGPQRVRQLAAAGANFDLDEAGHILLTREGGHHADRIAHAGGDATGAEISRALLAALAAVADDPGIEVIEDALVLDLLTSTDGRVCGVTLHVIGEGEHDGVGSAHARAVVLATGGLGQIYTSTTNPSVATGDGVAAALRAGAAVTDLEFVQFHPTVLYLGEGSTGQQPLISEAVRGEGAVLRDEEGEAFMQGVHPLADLAPRDVVARAILERMAATGAEHVWLDARALGADFLARRFPTILARCRDLGIDPATDLLPVAPAQHYASGGVRVDLHGRSSLDGLWAVGEVSCTGVHGANRLASNSLLEGLVFAHRAAEDIHARLAKGALPQASPAEDGPTGALVDGERRVALQRVMTRGAGPIRSAAPAAEALETLAEASAGAESSGGAEPGPDAWESTNLLHLGQVLLTGALLREESRGGHVRSDHHERDDTNWCAHLLQVRDPDDGEVAVIKLEVEPALPATSLDEETEGEQ